MHFEVLRPIKKKPHPSPLAEALHRVKFENHCTARAIARQCDMHQSRISRFMTGKNKIASLAEAIKFRDVFGIPVEISLGVPLADKKKSA